MKIITGLVNWIFKIWDSYKSIKSVTVEINSYDEKFQTEFVVDVPDNLLERKIFIVKDGNFPELLVLKCPCGCDAIIQLNLLNDASPLWQYNFNNKGHIDVYPSVWRKTGCKSHFFIRDSNIDWVD